MVGLKLANSLSPRTMEPREGREGNTPGRPSRRSQLVPLLVAVIAAAILITLLFQVPFLEPILGTPLAFADLLAIVLGASYVVTFRLVDRRHSNGRAS